MNIEQNMHPAAAITDVLGGEEEAALLRSVAPTAFETADEFFHAPNARGHLTPRLRELLLLAMHATPTALDAGAVDRQVGRALAAGATPAEVIDVLMTTVGVANHALYEAVPLLEDALGAAGAVLEEVGTLDDAFEAVKRDFVDTRGFWNPDRERFARLMPEYFKAVCALSVDPWKNGPLSTKKREFVCIAIDCIVTHDYQPGLRLHIVRALEVGAEPREILEIFQFAGIYGLESLALGLRALTRAGISAASQR